MIESPRLRPSFVDIDPVTGTIHMIIWTCGCAWDDVKGQITCDEHAVSG